MSRKLGALVLAMGILAGAMGIKTVLTAKMTGGTMMANGPAPPPAPRYPPPKTAQPN
jgi:acyl CoA:acetate/3-ketoacid CoA transferase alpha subunit